MAVLPSDEQDIVLLGKRVGQFHGIIKEPVDHQDNSHRVKPGRVSSVPTQSDIQDGPGLGHIDLTVFIGNEDHVLQEPDTEVQGVNEPEEKLPRYSVVLPKKVVSGFIEVMGNGPRVDRKA